MLLRIALLSVVVITPAVAADVSKAPPTRSERLQRIADELKALGMEEESNEYRARAVAEEQRAEKVKLAAKNSVKSAKMLITLLAEVQDRGTLKGTTTQSNEWVQHLNQIRRSLETHLRSLSFYVQTNGERALEPSTGGLPPATHLVPPPTQSAIR